MKPQTLLVDLDPNRMFVMQELKSQIYNVNVDKTGNSKLAERLEKELKISPIIVVNQGKIKQVTQTDILEAISDYSKDRGVAEETNDIPIDLQLLDIKEIREAIEKENELSSKAGFSKPAAEGEETDLDVPDEDEPGDDENGTGDGKGKNGTKKEDEEKNVEKQFKSYYAKILFYAFLTKDTVISLAEIVKGIGTKDNARIAHNIGITKKVLSVLEKNLNPFHKSKLDYKIQNINKLGHDTKLSPVERAETVIQKIGKLGDAEVITPSAIAEAMVELITDNTLKDAIINGNKLLDIASKTGEFSIAIYKKYLALGKELKDFAELLYAIPTSAMSYEFTRKVYDDLELPLKNIASSFNSYDLLNVKLRNGSVDVERIERILSQKKNFDLLKLDDNPRRRGKVRFNAVIGNPPYQGESTSTRKPPVYNEFYNLAFALSDFVTLITPARFLFEAGQTPKDWNKKMLRDCHFRVEKYYDNSKQVFEDVDIKGGVAITIHDTNETFQAIGVFSPHEIVSNLAKRIMETGEHEIQFLDGLVSSRGTYRFSDQFFNDYPDAEQLMGDGTGNMIASNVFENMPNIFLKTKEKKNCIGLLGRINNARETRYIKKEYVIQNEYIDKYNVLVAESNGTGKFGEILSTPVICKPGEGALDTFISIGCFDSLFEAEALFKYLQTKFVRALLGLKKVTQHNPKTVWVNVPIQDFTEQAQINWLDSIDNINEQLYDLYDLTEDERNYIDSHVQQM